MKKGLLIALFLFLSVISVFAANDKPIITVLDFNSDGVSEAEMKSIINYLSSFLFKTGKFTVIDVSQRENILNELEFSMSGCSDESCYLEVGKILSAEGIVVGNIGRVGSRFILTAKLLETETGATISSADGMYNNLDELLDDIYAAAAELGRPYGDVTAMTAEEIPKAEPAEVEPAATPEVKPDAETVEQPETGKAVSPDINFPAWGSLAAAAGCLGAGGYFLAVSLPLFIDYMSAQKAYDGATDSATAAEMYIQAETARAAAVEGNVNLNLPLGTGLAAAGIGFGILSAVLFSGNRAEELPVETVFLPVPGGAALSFHMTY